MNETLTLEVTTYLFGLGAERRAPPVYVELHERVVAARTLIEEHVRAEVLRAYQCRTSSLALHYMLDDSVRTAPSPAAALTLDVATETARAYAGLVERRYVLVVDGCAISDLHEPITLTERSNVCFIRLLPLVGG